MRGEIHRALSEVEQGVSKYKASSERYEQIREFDELAKKNGRELPETLKTVAAFEDAMQKNPLAALNFALREVGPKKPDGTPLTIDDFVAHIHGQSDDQRLQAANNEIAELRKQLSDIQTQQKAAEVERALPKMINDFAANNPRFDELADTIAVLIETGTAKDLDAAYKLADTLKPASQGGASPAPNGAHTANQNGAHTAKPEDDAEAQTLKAQEAAAEKAAKTLKGAPTPGASRARSGQTSSIRDSILKAFEQAG